MKTITEIKKEQQNKISDLFKSCGVFFAFSNEQFNENKTALAEGDKYVSTGSGGYLPKSKSAEYLTGMSDISKWYKDTIKAGNLRKAYILYELNNHEAFYTCDIEDTLAALGSDYSAEEVYQVYKDNRELADI